MQEPVQFETIVESGVIHIPEQYVRQLPDAVVVTLVPSGKPHAKIRDKTKSNALTTDDFSALKINTRGWKFNRDEAHER